MLFALTGTLAYAQRAQGEFIRVLHSDRLRVRTDTIPQIKVLEGNVSVAYGESASFCDTLIIYGEEVAVAKGRVRLYVSDTLELGGTSLFLWNAEQLALLTGTPATVRTPSVLLLAREIHYLFGEGIAHAFAPRVTLIKEGWHITASSLQMMDDTFRLWGGVTLEKGSEEKLFADTAVFFTSERKLYRVEFPVGMRLVRASDTLTCQKASYLPAGEELRCTEGTLKSKGTQLVAGSIVLLADSSLVAQQCACVRDSDVVLCCDSLAVDIVGQAFDCVAGEGCCMLEVESAVLLGSVLEYYPENPFLRMREAVSLRGEGFYVEADSMKAWLSGDTTHLHFFALPARFYYFGQQQDTSTLRASLIGLSLVRDSNVVLVSAHGEALLEYPLPAGEARSAGGFTLQAPHMHFIIYQSKLEKFLSTGNTQGVFLPLQEEDHRSKSGK